MLTMLMTLVIILFIKILKTFLGMSGCGLVRILNFDNITTALLADVNELIGKHNNLNKKKNRCFRLTFKHARSK